jgi:hypothetical protein
VKSFEGLDGLKPLGPWFTRLYDNRPGYVIFPSLQSIQLDGNSKYTSSMLLPSSIRRLEICFGRNSDASRNGESYFLAAMSQTPQLEELTLRGIIPPPILLHVQTFKNLRKLNLSKIDLPHGVHPSTMAGLLAISRMRTLVDLHLPDNAFRTRDVAQNSGGFCRLQNLRIRGSAHFITKFIAALSPATLVTISIILIVDPMTPRQAHTIQFRSCIEQLVAQCAASLHHMTLHIHMLEPLDRVFDWRPTLDVLGPLRQLETFCYIAPGTLFSIEDVQVVVSAWSALRHLKLDVDIRLPFSNSPNPHAPTIHSLAVISQLCPKLEQLRMPLHKDLPDISEVPLLSHPLRRLELSIPGVEDILQLARLIDRVFPSLTEISVNAGATSSLGGGEISRLISTFQSIRNERRPVVPN